MRYGLLDPRPRPVGRGTPPHGTLHAVVARNVRRLMATSPDLRTQAALCKASGIDQTDLSNHLAGRRGWSLWDIERLAAVFAIEPADLLRPPSGGDGAMRDGCEIGR